MVYTKSATVDVGNSTSRTRAPGFPYGSKIYGRLKPGQASQHIEVEAIKARYLRDIIFTQKSSPASDFVGSYVQKFECEEKVRSHWRTALERIKKDKSLELHPNQWVIDKSSEIVAFLAAIGLHSPGIEALSDGGINFSFCGNDRYSDIELYNSNEICATTSNRAGSIQTWMVTPDEMGKTLEHLLEFVGLSIPL